MDQLRKLEAACLAALTKAVDHSDCVILLTNAGAGWVEQSGKCFIPGVIEKMNELGIRIISAQADYGKKYPGEPAQWKKAAFQEKLNGRSINLVSIGDSMFERRAAQHAGSIKDDHIEHTKTVKFIENPTIEELCTELQVLASSLDEVCSLKSSADWDLTLVSNQWGPCPQRSAVSSSRCGP